MEERGSNGDAALGERGPQSVEVSGVVKSFDATVVLRDVALRASAGSVLALLGPSGCGKTTLLRIVAGLEAPDAGVVKVGGRTLTSDTVRVPPERRRVGMVFQDWALFPHLSVADNVAYGLPWRERRRRGRGARVPEALALVGLSGMGSRRPATLSGGQQQRVALARALAPRPSVLLLDEPFSNLDTSLRVQVRSEVHRLVAELGVTTVFVTHDQEEAFVLGSQVAVISGGVVVQQGTPTELYERPAAPWVATFVGDANLVAGTATGETASTPLGAVPLRSPTEGQVEVLVRPECVSTGGGEDGLVTVVEYYGHDTVYELALDGVTVRVREGGPPRWRSGDRVAVAYRGEPTTAWPSPLPAAPG